MTHWADVRPILPLGHVNSSPIRDDHWDSLFDMSASAGTETNTNNSQSRCIIIDTLRKNRSDRRQSSHGIRLEGRSSCPKLRPAIRRKEDSQEKTDHALGWPEARCEL